MEPIREHPNEGINEEVVGKTTIQPVADDNPTNEHKPIECIQDIIGNWGPWQRSIFFFYLSISIFQAFNNLGLSLMAPKTDFWCKESDHTFKVSMLLLNSFKNFLIQPESN